MSFDINNLRIGVVGLGYVGLPLAVAVAEQGYPTTGFDIDPDKVERLNVGRSYLSSVPARRIAAQRKQGRFAEIGRAHV